MTAQTQLVSTKDVESIIAQIDDGTRLLRLREVIEIVGFKHSHIYGLIKENKFPKPIKLGPKSSVWLSTQITAWKKEAIREALLQN
ncbi:MAG: AlpA family transcriptional regulator [Bdellovibrionales bacterium]